MLGTATPTVLSGLKTYSHIFCSLKYQYSITTYYNSIPQFGFIITITIVLAYSPNIFCFWIHWSYTVCVRNSCKICNLTKVGQIQKGIVNKVISLYVVVVLNKAQNYDSLQPPLPPDDNTHIT